MEPVGKGTLLSHFPYKEARQNQIDVLETLDREWDQYDVFVIECPTGSGKSGLSKAILNKYPDSSYIAPNNLLVQQFLKEFPNTPTLARLDSYSCGEWKRDCASTRGKIGKFCAGCPCGKALAKAKFRRSEGAYNYHVYLAYRLYRSTLVIDEAHNLLPHIREKEGLRIWQHDANYPSRMYSHADMLEWLRSLPKNKFKGKKFSILLAALTAEKPKYIVSRAREEFNGKGTVRGEPEMRDCLKLLPVDISKAPPMFWPGSNDKGPGVQKIVLLSATINERDVRDLGLTGEKQESGGTNKHRRVLYIRAKSPIPVDHRPIVVDPVTSVNRINLADSVARIAKHLQEVILPHHDREKGVIHVTYQMAELLKAEIGTAGGRLMYHTRLDKAQVYSRFRASKPEHGCVLVACGMYEGIDLPGDAGTWQVITKIPWPSLGDPAVAYRAKLDPDYYLWETLRVLVQASGRICRGPEDFGVTYILDGSVNRLLEQGKHLVPEYFSEAIVRP